MFDHHTFEDLMRKKGQQYRAALGRRTLRFEDQGKGYFIKQHYGIGWKEILKNLFQGRLPIVGAKNEWLANQAVRQVGISTIKVLSYEQRGWNPASKRSYIISEELLGCQSLEDLVKDEKFDFLFKRELIKAIALLTRTMHLSGINHRDYYLCHLWWHFKEKQLYLMDLHRAQIRKKVPPRWLIKDIAGLYFSSMDVSLTSRDFLRFLKIYFKKSIKAIFKQEKDFLSAVEKRANKLYIKTFFKDPEYYFNQKTSVSLKNGDTSTVILVEARNKKIVIKRYNILNLFHWLRRGFRKSRAKKSWRGAHLLMAAGISTNKPIGFFEKAHFFGLLHSTTYFISEYVQGITLDKYFNEPISVDKKELVLDKIISMFKKMKENNLVHGDMKATNFLINNEVPYLIDVDAVRKFTRKKAFNRKFKKDMNRFLRNWSDSEETKAKIVKKLTQEKIL